MVRRMILILLLLLGFIVLAAIMLVAAVTGMIVVFNFMMQDMKFFVLCALCVLLIPTAFIIYLTR